MYDLKQGGGPLLLSMPHVGTDLPPELPSRLTAEALQLVDTDWRVEELYNFLDALDLSVITARYSRYVVDLNRPLDGESLYPGQPVSEICPLQSFAGGELYRGGEQPGRQEVRQRVEDYWQPYHRALTAELDRIKALHGYALLWDAHSIRSEVPRLFAGSLPDLSFGTAGGASCAAELIAALEAVVAAAPAYTWITNGRFTGGAITRRYGQPGQAVHAVQLELSQATYLEQLPPFQIVEQRADAVRPLLQKLVETMIDWTPPGTGEKSCSH